MAGEVMRRCFVPNWGFFEDAAFLAVNHDDIYVRTVIEFLAAQFAQAEHATFSWLPLSLRVLMVGRTKSLGQLLVTNLPRGIEADIGDIRNLLRDLGQVAKPRQIASGDAKHLALFEIAQMP